MFQKFAVAVHAQFTDMSKHELFVVDIDPDALWAAYLAAFPEGTDPIFRVNTEHTCSCCRNFIKNIGNVVAIVDGELHSVWDSCTDLPAPYDRVSAQLAILVRGAAVKGLFRSSEPAYGAATSKELRDGVVHTWNHFHGTVARKHFGGKEADKLRGEYATTVGVFRRGLLELRPSALAEVLELIDANALYRGEEHRAALNGFRGLQSAFLQNLAAPARENFIWANATSPFARFRNTAIGTLVIDLSEGVPLEQAVKAFETKVAPTNYKRPTALVTEGMKKQALQTIHELGLEAALERRLANIGDITMNNVKWADNSVKPLMKGGIAGILDTIGTSVSRTPGGLVHDIAIASFMADVVPSAASIDLLVKNSQQGNFVTLTAPVHADVGQLFKWDNNFAWSYDGNVADSMKERVKKAGGSVEGDLCCRLAWDYTDDLDFHMVEPSGHRIYFGNKRQLSLNGGMLDVDANGGDGIMKEPVENIFYADKSKMRDGVYTLSVNNFTRRSSGKGFEVEIEFGGQTHRIDYAGALRDSETVEVALIGYTRRAGFEIIKSLPASTGPGKSHEKWGVKTEQLAKVRTILESPNYWDDNATGNLHTFFILEGCRTDTAARGIYNEFLHSRLDAHRKVFEVLGDRMKCPPVDDQLSGVGFSSTRGDEVLVSVTRTNGSRATYNIIF